MIALNARKFVKIHKSLFQYRKYNISCGQNRLERLICYEKFDKTLFVSVQFYALCLYNFMHHCFCEVIRLAESDKWPA